MAFEARLDTKTAAGSLVIYWPNAAGGCSGNVSWPVLDTATFLGVPTADPNSVTVLVSTAPFCAESWSRVS